jgi:hypothetical protein
MYKMDTVRAMRGGDLSQVINLGSKKKTLEVDNVVSLYV